MSFQHFTVEVDGDGLALITWNSRGRSMNVIDAAVLEELTAIVEQVAADAAIKNVVIASGKENFCAGADLTMLESMSRAYAELMASKGETAANEHVFEQSRKTSVLYRRIETCGKPWVAAIAGIAVGGGFELTLACHHRVAAENARVGLPEIKVGLFPGAGGTQRSSCSRASRSRPIAPRP